ncbi:MAG: hypothetical protein K6A44_05305 [bacterium]|nr:hypothetical protein [bacterium]
MTINPVKKQQDSPFLTLSQRNQAGLSSQNISGEDKTKQAQEAKEASFDSIFARQSQGGVGNQHMFAQEAEQGAEQYLQEDENGDVNFDVSGFYNDAWGVNLNNSGASNPIGNDDGSVNSAGGAQSAQGKDKNSEIKQLKDKLKNLIQNDAPDREKEEVKDRLASYGLKDDDIKKVEQEGQKEKVDTSEADDKKMSDTKENVVAITAPSVEKNAEQTFGNIGTSSANTNSNGLSGAAGAELKELNTTLSSCKQDISSAKRNLDSAARKYSKAENENERESANNEVNKFKKEIEAQQKKQQEAQERKEELLKQSGKVDLTDKNSKEIKKNTSNPIKH